MASEGWSKRFYDPIVLDDGTTLRTLQEAVAYLAKTMPKAEQNHPKVRAAAHMLTYAAERETGWMFFARAATLRAIYRNEERVFNPDRKDHHWGKRKLKRDQ
jgi:hypothetical protein